MKTAFFDDDLASLPVTNTTQAADITTKVQVATTTTNNKPTATAAGDEFEFGDESYASSTKLPRIKPEKGQCARFALVAGIKPKATDTHYIDGKGTFICVKENCPACNAGNQAKTRIVALAARYTNAEPKTGKLGANAPAYELGWVLLSRSNYSQMLSVLPEDTDAYGVDWKMNHSNRAFGYELSVAATPAAYKRAGAEGTISELAAEYLDGVELAKKLGKRATVVEMRAAIAGLGSDAPEVSMDALGSWD